MIGGKIRIRMEAYDHQALDASAREIEEQVYSSIKDFAAGAVQSDDLTMVVVKVTGDVPDDDDQIGSDSPRKARGGPPAARGAPAMGDLRGPAVADHRETELAN